MSSVKELEEKVKELMKEIEKLKQQVVKAEEFDYPFEDGEIFWLLNDEGTCLKSKWNTLYNATNAYVQGHVFKTEQEAVREREKRTLLVRFRQFRDKCNGDWKPHLKIVGLPKYCIAINNKTDVMFAMDVTFYNEFNPFGYFEKKKDCQRAIQLFGDEIKRLWVDE